MNRELGRITGLVFLLFFALFAASSGIQVLSADALAADQRNVRGIYESYKTQRGAILVDGRAVAYSLKSGDEYRYLRQYQSGIYSHVTGYYSLFQGATGIEAAMNDYLSGQNSSQFFEQINSVLSGNPVTGAAVELTIDPDVQKAAWQAMGKMRGAVVAIEPSSGRILALVSKPGFDADLLADHDQGAASANYERLLGAKNRPLINRALAGDLYVPGSVFKLVVAAAALESKEYEVSSEIKNPKRFKLPGTETFVQNSGEGACGGQKTVSLETALALSCNVPFAQLGIALGQDRIRAQANLFGFGKVVEVPMTATASSYPEGLDEAQTGLTGFGQYDVRVTPLQMAMVSSAIANSGILMQPYLVENVISQNLSVLEQSSPKVFAQPISEDTARNLKQMMLAAVNLGVSSNAQISGVAVAGKTGTAENGEGEPYTLWFTGFAPADNPRVAVAVVIEDGGGMGQNGFGNLLAAPVARAVIQAVLNK